MNKLLISSAFIALLMSCCSKPNSGPGGDDGPDPTIPVEETDKDVFKGSFLQHWYVSGWSQTRWDEEMDILVNAGMEYLVFTPLLDFGATSADYASLEKCLKSANGRNIKVFVGPNNDQKWFGSNIDASWLNGQMETGNKICDEVHKRFKAAYPNALYGWYWDWEIDNLNWNTAARKSLLTGAMNISLDHLTALDPSMPVMFCPFMNSAFGTPTQYRDFWKSVFPSMHLRKGDIFCPQDCVGAGGVQLASVKSWFYQLGEAVKTVDGLKFWADVETFEGHKVDSEDNFVTAPLGRMVDQLKAVSVFVEKSICFAYCHYMSPKVAESGYDKYYREYVKTGNLPEIGVPRPVSSTSATVGTGVELKWTLATKENADGFSIYKNGSLYIKLQVLGGKYPDYYFDYSGKKTDKYQIATYNLMGKESAKVSFTP